MKTTLNNSTKDILKAFDVDLEVEADQQHVNKKAKMSSSGDPNANMHGKVLQRNTNNLLNTGKTQINKNHDIDTNNKGHSFVSLKK